METTGLASLEAAAMGCSLVVTPNGDTREYFADFAEYCDPGDQRSIRDAVMRAYENGPPPDLARRIRGNFTWEKAAEATYCAYKRVLT
jgi:glycosyltransferase involved in cell wall biosynthesis